jgi:hypothetical protein
MTVLLGTLGFFLAACSGDPKDVGITGPFPNGVPAVTLTRPVARSDIAVDTPGIGAPVLDRYAPSARSTTGPAGKRYYGYDY